MRRPANRLVLVWLALLVLLCGNVAVAHLGMGYLTTAANLAVAIVMALTVLGVFMELSFRASLFWVFAGAGFFWLILLFGLIAVDYLTRYSYAPT